MDAIFPAVIGAGIYLMYYAWESHVKGTVPHPVKKLTSAIKGEAYKEEASGAAQPASADIGNAPYTGPTNTVTVQGQQVTLGAGTSVGPGGSLHG